jgi:arabinogalactan endo-1,4-beta-galactosidase
MSARNPQPKYALVGFAVVCLGLLIGTSSGAGQETAAGEFIRGVDASYVTRVEEKGGSFFHRDGSSGEVFEILSENGVNYVRFRIWNEPPEGYCSEADVLELARRAHQAGLKILLDFHYSDEWADPGTQTKPAAWESLSYSELVQAVHDYTLEVVQDLMAQGTPPDMVQIGNEIPAGMLWDDGRVWPDEFNTPEQWAKLAELIEAGIQGVQEAGSSAEIMIHIDKGGDNAGARGFFDSLLAQGVEFDIIGLSYYSTWHGPIETMSANLVDLAGRYGKPIVLAETAYPWTLGWADDTNNIIGLESQLLPGYPATVAGQTAFLQAVRQALEDVPGGLGRGFFYWEGTWIATSDHDHDGSPWENQALFDFEHVALGSLDAFAPGNYFIFTPLIMR